MSSSAATNIDPLRLFTFNFETSGKTQEGVHTRPAGGARPLAGGAPPRQNFFSSYAIGEENEKK